MEREAGSGQRRVRRGFGRLHRVKPHYYLRREAARAREDGKDETAEHNRSEERPEDSLTLWIECDTIRDHQHKPDCGAWQTSFVRHTPPPSGLLQVGCAEVVSSSCCGRLTREELADESGPVGDAVRD